MRAGGAPLDALQHRAALVKQLRTLQTNHEALLGALQRKIDAQMAQGAAGTARAGLAGSKHYLPPVFPAGPEGKRQRVLHERELRIAAIWDDANKIVDRLRKNSKAAPFLHPVDPVKLKIPDYYTLIASPMDLGSVKKKLTTNKYTSPLEVLADVRQVFTNCRIYNPAHTPVAKQGEALSELFERSWGQLDMENRWAMELKQKERQDQMLANGLEDAEDDSTPVRMQDMRQQLGDYIAAADQKPRASPAAPGSGAAAGGAAGGGGPRAMSFEEKRKLSAHLSSLPGEKLPRVIEILHEASMLDADADADQEVELDVDQLSPATLWALRKYVDSVLQPSGAPPKKTPGSGQRPPPDKRPPPSKQAPGSGGGAGGAAGVGVNGGGGGGGGTQPPAAGMQPPAARAQQGGGGNGGVGSPQRSEEANSGGGVVESSGRMDGQRGMFGLNDAGTVAQSGIHNNPSTAFLKSQRKVGDVKHEMDMAAWANVGAKAEDAAAANGAGAGEAKAGDEGDGDAVWADFAQRAAQEEQKKEQAAEAEAQRKAEEEQRQKEEEEQKQQAAQAEQQQELARQAALQAKGRLVDDPSDMVDQVRTLQKGNGGGGHMMGLGIAAVDEDSEGGFDSE